MTTGEMWLTKKTWTSARNQADSPMTSFCPNHCTTAAFVKVTYDLHVANPMNRSQSSRDMTSQHHLNKVVHSLDPWNPRFWATVLSWFSSLLTGHSSSVSWGRRLVRRRGRLVPTAPTSKRSSRLDLFVSTYTPVSLKVSDPDCAQCFCSSLDLLPAPDAHIQLPTLHLHVDVK